jgi:LemA protein
MLKKEVYMKASRIVFISTLGALLLVLLIGSLILIRGYNLLITYDESLDESYAQVFNRLKQRHDTITQMVDTISGLQEHEQEIYQMIISARMAYANAIASKDVDALAEADALESFAVSALLVVLEDNPRLSVTQSFESLLDTIYSIESSLSVARRDYNQNVATYNRYVRRFPGMIFASLFDFDQKIAYWMINEGESEVPTIDFNNE